ncbi:hypothetical protein [Streptomyces sp. NPDC015345]|uniref:hypothetical protein n=1 Tax=Streptomyces sp. NPDC015345 TaxID=3364953 RepID=UPI003700073F
MPPRNRTTSGAPSASLVGELLESALNSHQGTFMVVSHDERFLSAIGVNRRLPCAEKTAPSVTV